MSSPEEDLRSFIAGIDGFAAWSHADKIRMFAWLQPYLFDKEYFKTGEINWCYDKLAFDKPNISQFLKTMEGKSLLKEAKGYRCEGKFRAKYDQKYGEHQITQTVRQMVKDLVNDLPQLGEKDIYQEAMTCLRYNAGRATIIMVWNIAFYHLCTYIVTHKKDDFNNRIPVRYPGKWKPASMPLIAKYEDFGDNMAEREVIEVANSAGIIDSTMYKVYKAKLDDRNTAAHPSTAHVTQVQAEGFIDSLINNTVKLLKI